MDWFQVFRERLFSGRRVPPDMARGFESTRMAHTARRLKIGGALLLVYIAARALLPAPPTEPPISGALVASLFLAVTLAHLALLAYRGDNPSVRGPLCYSFVFCLCAVEALAIVNAAAPRRAGYPTEFLAACAALALVPAMRPRVVAPLSGALYLLTVALVLLNRPLVYETHTFLLHATLTLLVCWAASFAAYRAEEAVYMDASYMRRLTLDLSDMANHDELTKLLNRRAFETHFPVAIAQCRRDKRQLAVMMLDVDCFKYYNDDYGHPAGDKALFRVAECCAASFRRENDVLARYGGEEFVIVAQVSAEDAESLARTICHRVAAMTIPNPRSTALDILTVSIGVASLIPGENDTRESILTAADEALYEAKTAGRNRVVVRKLDKSI